MRVIELLYRCIIKIHFSGLSCKNEDQYLLDRKLAVNAQYPTNDRNQSDEEGLVNEASEEHNDMLSYLDNADLKDYSHIQTTNVEDSHLAYIPCKDGPPRLVRKSAIVWFAESGVRRLSNDRLSRVMQTADFQQRSKAIVSVVGRQTVRVQDWCIFKNESEDCYFLGKVVVLAITDNENLKRIKYIFEWDGQDKNVGALCTWYNFERLTNGNLTGILKECNEFTYGFHSCRYYVCSCPPPSFANVNESRDLVFPQFVITQLSSLFEHMPVRTIQ